MPATPLTIGRLAAATGCNIETIRYYERIGLLPAPSRSAGQQRQYDRTACDRLTFIRHCRELGFSLTAIRELLSLSDRPEQSCEAADRIARVRLAEVDIRLARLGSLKAELERMIGQCRGGRIADCRVIEALADHSLCLTAIHGSREAMMPGVETDD